MCSKIAIKLIERIVYDDRVDLGMAVLAKLRSHTLTESIKICFRVNSLSGEVNLMGRNSQQRQQQNPKPPRSSLQDSLSIRSKITLESPLFMSFSLRICSILA